MPSRGPYRRHSGQFKLPLCSDIRSGKIGRQEAQKIVKQIKAEGGMVMVQDPLLRRVCRYAAECGGHGPLGFHFAGRADGRGAARLHPHRGPGRDQTTDHADGKRAYSGDPARAAVRRGARFSRVQTRHESFPASNGAWASPASSLSPNSANIPRNRRGDAAYSRDSTKEMLDDIEGSPWKTRLKIRAIRVAYSTYHKWRRLFSVLIGR